MSTRFIVYGELFFIIIFSIEVKLHNYTLTKFFYLFFKTGINKEHCIVKRRLFQNHVFTADNQEAKWTDIIAQLELWTDPDLNYFFNSAVGDFQDKEG